MPVSKGFASPVATANTKRVAVLANPTAYTSQAWKRLSRHTRSKYPICQYCGDKLAASADHINGDTDDSRASNVVSACTACHAAKTARFETRGRSAAIKPATLEALYNTLASYPPQPALDCRHWSPHTYLSAIITQQWRGWNFFRTLESTSHLLSNTNRVDALVASFLQQPTDDTLSRICLVLNVHPDTILAFTHARSILKIA